MMRWHETGEAGKPQVWFLVAGILVLTGIGTVWLMVGGTRAGSSGDVLPIHVPTGWLMLTAGADWRDDRIVMCKSASPFTVGLVLLSALCR